MKKNILIGFITIIVCFLLVGCGENNSVDESVVNNSNSKSIMSNSSLTVDGIYLNNEYTDEDGLKEVVLFYTLNVDDENMDVSSSSLKLKINKNEYENTWDSIATPKLTQYYYSSTTERVYVGKSIKVAAIYKVPEGDLVPDKTITLKNDAFSYINTGKIKMSTNDIKIMDNLTDISLDVDKEYATSKQEEENEKLILASDEVSKKISEAINGSYYEFKVYYGTYVKYRLEFIEPNKFEVTANIISTNTSISNKGTYEITNSYIVLHYDTNAGNSSYEDKKVPYEYRDGVVYLTNPFDSDDSESLF